MPTAKQLAQSLAALAQVGEKIQCAKFLQQLGQLPREAQVSIRQAALATVERTPTGQEILASLSSIRCRSLLLQPRRLPQLKLKLIHPLNPPHRRPSL